MRRLTISRTVMTGGVAGMVLFSALSGCGKSNSDLDRGQALDLVKAAVTVAPPDDGCLALRPNGWEDGQNQGYWTDTYVMEKGYAVIKSATRSGLCLRKPPSFPIEIQGIADTGIEGYKEIQFHISNDAIPDPVRRFITTGYEGRAVARRFDDGWRLEDGVKLQAEKAGFDPTDEEQQKIGKDYEAEIARRAEVAAFDAERQQAHAELVAASRTPKQTPEQFHCSFQSPAGTSQIDLSISDVGIFKQSAGSNLISRTNIGFGHITDFRAEDGWLRVINPQNGNANHTTNLVPVDCPAFEAARSSLARNYKAWRQQYDAVGTEQ